jgi:hypothetical protein
MRPGGHVEPLVEDGERLVLEGERPGVSVGRRFSNHARSGVWVKPLVLE